MGKNKRKSNGKPKEKSIFKVAGSKVTKGKAKPVTTNLKRVSECLYHLLPVERIICQFFKTYNLAFNLIE